MLNCFNLLQDDTCVYIDKRVTYIGMKMQLSVSEIWSQGENLACGYISHSTRVCSMLQLNSDELLQNAKVLLAPPINIYALVPFVSGENCLFSLRSNLVGKHLYYCVSTTFDCFKSTKSLQHYNEKPIMIRSKKVYKSAAVLDTP